MGTSVYFKTVAGGYLQTSVKERYEMTEKPTLQEKALGRLFMFREDSHSVREFDLEQLLKWPGLSNCRYAVDAIVSAALGSWIHNQAQKWIQNQEDKTLIIAVALNRAKGSKEIRTAVRKEIFDYHRIILSSKIQGLLHKMEDGQDVSWSEIREVIGVDDFEIMPPLNRPDLFAHSWRVMEDPSQKDGTLAAIREIFASTDLTDKPFLRRWIVESTLSVNTEEVLGIIQEHFLLFAEEIVDVLTTDELPSRSIFSGKKSWEYSNDIGFFQNFFKLAKLFVDSLEFLAKRQKQRLIQRLFKAKNNPWIWYIADKLCKQNTGSWRLVPNFLVSWLSAISQDYGSRNPTEWKGFGRDNLGDVDMREFHSTLMLLPDDFVRIFAKRSISQNLSNRFFQAMSSEGLHFIKEVWDKIQVFLGVLEEQIKKVDRINPDLIDKTGILIYLKAVGFEKGREVLTHWLKKYQGEFHIGYQEEPELLTKYVVPYDLSAGVILTSSNVDDLLRLGYRLKPEDIQSEDDVIKIVFLESRGEIKFSKHISIPDLWNNKSWREVIFASNCAHKWVIWSLLVTAYQDIESEERLDWLEKILIPECEKQEELQRALHLIAWEELSSVADFEVRWSTELARLLLIKDERWQKWMDEEPRSTLVNSYCERNWSRLLTCEKEVAATALTQKEQLDLFFRKASDLVESPDDLYAGQLKVVKERPTEYQDLFSTQKAKKRLTKWLLAHRDEFDLEKWLEWVKELDLMSIDDRVHRWVFDALNKGGREAELALAILQTV